MRGGGAAGSPSTPASRACSACSPPTTSSRRRRGPAAPRATRARRPPHRGRDGRPAPPLPAKDAADAAAGAAQGLARAGHDAALRGRRPRRCHARSDVDYRATIDDPRIDDVRILRPQEIPRYVADGLFDLGITGRDWIEETGADVVTLTELHYSKATARPTSIVLAVAADSPVQSRHGPHRRRARAHRVPGADPPLLREARHRRRRSRFSYGATEAKVPEIADAVVELTETGRALRAAGLRIVDTVLVSHTELFANPTAYADPEKRRAMEQVMTLLSGALEARGRVLVKLNVDGRPPRRRDRAPSRAEVAHGLEAVRRTRRSRSRPWWRRARSTR